MSHCAPIKKRMFDRIVGSRTSVVTKEKTHRDEFTQTSTSLFKKRHLFFQLFTNNYYSNSKSPFSFHIARFHRYEIANSQKIPSSRTHPSIQQKPNSSQFLIFIAFSFLILHVLFDVQCICSLLCLLCLFFAVAYVFFCVHINNIKFSSRVPTTHARSGGDPQKRMTKLAVSNLIKIFSISYSWKRWF